MKKTIVIADDNTAFVEQLKDYFNKTNDYEIVGIASDGREAVTAIEKLSPNFALIDIVMPELDGFGVLQSINTAALETEPTIIMMSQLSADGFVSKSIRYGAHYYLAKPFSFDTLLRFMNESSRGEKTVRPEKEAIKMAIFEPDIINSITKRLYPTIAERFQTTPSKVERAIRHAIEVSWNRGKIENINNIFGIKVYSANEKPTNGEFIALVADKMLLEGVC